MDTLIDLVLGSAALRSRVHQLLSMLFGALVVYGVESPSESALREVAIWLLAAAALGLREVLKRRQVQQQAARLTTAITTAWRADPRQDSIADVAEEVRGRTDTPVPVA